MERLVSVAAEFLARKPYGCNLQEVFGHVHTSPGPFSLLKNLPEAAKNVLWQEIAKDSDAFLLFCLERQDDVTSRDACTIRDVDGAADGTDDRGRKETKKTSKAAAKKKDSAKTEANKGVKEGKGGQSENANEVFMVTKEARGVMDLGGAQAAGVRVGLKRTLRLVALGIRADCVDRSTAKVHAHSLVRALCSGLHFCMLRFFFLFFFYRVTHVYGGMKAAFSSRKWRFQPWLGHRVEISGRYPG